MSLTHLPKSYYITLTCQSPIDMKYLGNNGFLLMEVIGPKCLPILSNP